MSASQRAATGEVKYTQCTWGDLVEGTKEQLQALGLGAGRAFPGEAGQGRRDLEVQDPRGYAVRVTRAPGRDDLFWAGISFPNWPARPADPEMQGPDVAHGLRKRQTGSCDEYVGTAQALADAGLVRLDQLPGAPGMRKTCTRILPDSSVPGGVTFVGGLVSGLRIIERASKSAYRVKVVVTPAEDQRRYRARREAEAEWEDQCRRLPRPARLIDLDLVRVRAAAGIRLAWSNSSDTPAVAAVAGPRHGRLSVVPSVRST